MSTQDTSDQPTRASVPQILAQLILIGQKLGLPDPYGANAHEDNGIASFDFRSAEAVRAWAQALGIADKVRSHRMSEAAGALAGHWHHGAHGYKVLGWSVNFTAVTPSNDAGRPVEPAIVAALEALAGAQ